VSKENKTLLRVEVYGGLFSSWLVTAAIAFLYFGDTYQIQSADCDTIFFQNKGVLLCGTSSEGETQDDDHFVVVYRDGPDYFFPNQTFETIRRLEDTLYISSETSEGECVTRSFDVYGHVQDIEWLEKTNQIQSQTQGEMVYEEYVDGVIKVKKIILGSGEITVEKEYAASPTTIDRLQCNPK
jgi:hypothetical protein